MPLLPRIIDRAVIVQSEANGRYHVRAESSNGEVVLTSEQYNDLAWARAVASELGVPVVEKLLPDGTGER